MKGRTRQSTYGRSVDDPLDYEKLRQDREARLREDRARVNRVVHPLDVRERAARLLGVQVSASDREIKQAVHRLALAHHPDRGGKGDQMAAILEARGVLLGRRSG
jgi:DnaJ-domain-containing protein 1